MTKETSMCFLQQINDCFYCIYNCHLLKFSLDWLTKTSLGVFLYLSRLSSVFTARLVFMPLKCIVLLVIAALLRAKTSGNKTDNIYKNTISMYKNIQKYNNYDYWVIYPSFSIWTVLNKWNSWNDCEITKKLYYGMFHNSVNALVMQFANRHS